MIGRRAFVGGLIGLVAAPSIVRACNIMPVKRVDLNFADPEISLFGMHHDGIFWRDSTGRKFSINPVGRISIRVVNSEIVEQNYAPGGDVYEHAPGLGALGFARVGRLSDEDYRRDRAELQKRIDAYSAHA